MAEKKREARASNKGLEVRIKNREKRKENFLKAFELSAGNVSIACAKAGIVRDTFYIWKKSDEEFKERVTDITESLLDMAETILLKGVKEGKTAELLFFLKTKGKKRGYVERVEHDINDVTELMRKNTADLFPDAEILRGDEDEE